MITRIYALLLCFFLSITALAASEKRQEFTVIDSEGGRHKVRAFYYTNDNGAPEVRLESAAIPRIAEGINPVLGYGRDLDDDGKIDTWFMNDKDEDFKVIHATSADPFCRDVIEQQLFKQNYSSAQMYLNSISSSLMGFFFMSASGAYHSQREFDWETVDIAERTIRLNRMRGQVGPGQISSLQYAYAKAELEEYTERSVRRLQEAGGKNYWLMAAADAGLWLSGGILIKWFGPLLTKAGISIAGSSAGRQAQLLVKRLLSKRIAKISLTKPLQAIGESGSRVAAATIVPLKAMSDEMVKRSFQRTSRALIARGRLGRIAAKVSYRALLGAKKAAAEWKYIVFFNIGLQTVSETIANAKEVEDPNPAVMVGRVLERPETQQNLAYMALDTVQMTAMSGAFKSNKMRFLSCGFVALNDSFTVNVLVKHDHNYERVGFDTGWEVGIGNAQVQLDMASLGYFERMATRTKNPKLKLLGYVVVLVDQGAGYVGYSKAAAVVEADEAKKAAARKIQNERFKTILVPVTAEQ